MSLLRHNVYWLKNQREEIKSLVKVDQTGHFLTPFNTCIRALRGLLYLWLLHALKVAANCNNIGKNIKKT